MLVHQLWITFKLLLAVSAQTTLLTFANSPIERLGCLMGSINNSVVKVDSIVINDTGDTTAIATRNVARQPCLSGTIGRVHSHPNAINCWYWFPGTRVETSDFVSFRRGGYPID